VIRASLVCQALTPRLRVERKTAGLEAANDAARSLSRE
jgi:hypothetical protein